MDYRRYLKGQMLSDEIKTEKDIGFIAYAMTAACTLGFLGIIISLIHEFFLN